MQLELTSLEQYLEQTGGKGVQIIDTHLLGGAVKGEAALKQFGYGRPILVTYRANGREEKIVLHLINRNAFGHERDDDRIATVWLDFNTFNRLPAHVPALDMIAYTSEGHMQSLKSAQTLLLVTAYRPGRPYADDLMRIRDEGDLQPLDMKRAETLAGYLAEIHQVKRNEPALWRRRLRDLIGHGEGVMGLTDSYPKDLSYVAEADLRALEEKVNRWRWRLKPLNHRLSQVHGDFHPFNILFEKDRNFHVLDRSRGEWGEPADDVSCLTVNYLFFSLQRFDKLEGPFQALHNKFWERYLALQPDEELLTVIQPWFAWRILVLASPIWYPTISEDTRRKLFSFANCVLSLNKYDYSRVNQYLETV